MNLLAYMRGLAAKFFRTSETAEEMDEELRSHLQFRADDLERSGMSRAEAERRARIEFGGLARYREECHEAQGGRLLSGLLQDARFAARVLRKSPGFLIAAVLTLALAIGANAVVFGIMSALIIRPLNVPRSENFYGIENGNDHVGSQSYPDYLDLRDRNHSFEQLAGFGMFQVVVDTGQDPSRHWDYETTGNYFDALGIPPYLGRVYHGSDERGPNSAPYVVLSYGYWHTHFHDDRSVLGRVIRLNKHPYTVIGVTPPEFHGTILFFSPDFFVPIINHEQLDGQDLHTNRGVHWIFEVVGHLKPGVTYAQATADLNAIDAYLERAYPKEEGHKGFSLQRPGLYGSFLGRPVRAFVAGLTLLSGLILLAACANLGSLFAARASDRSREIALRLALGSSRSRILRQSLTEAVIISLLGGASGLLLGVVILRRLAAWQPFPSVPIHVPLNPDASVYVVALLLALVSGFLFGVVPVRQVLRTNPYEVVKAGTNAGAGKRISVRDVLLVVQISICAVLVTSSLVAVRGLMRSLSSSFGFEPRNAMLVDTNLALAGYSGDSVYPMERRMIDALESVPGVESVGMVNFPPLGRGGSWTNNVFKDETRDLSQSNAAAVAYLYSTSPGFLQAAKVTLLSGRTFTWHDDGNRPLIAVVNQEFARRILGSEKDALGRYFRLQNGGRVQVVGVVQDGKYLSLTEDRKPAMFLPAMQLNPLNEVWFVVRSSRDPAQLSAAIRNALHSTDAGLPLDIETWSRELDFTLFPSRVATVSLGVLGMMGAMLSITGILGMAAYSVSKRFKELGIRVALGAKRREVLQAALGRAIKLLAVGSAAGLLLGVLASRVLAYIVYQATPRDPLVLACVVLAMLLLGLVATWIPAQRALSIDPMVLLREE